MSDQPSAIDPTRVYTREEAMAALRIGEHLFREEVRAGRLATAGPGKKQLFLGEALLAWLRRDRQ